MESDSVSGNEESDLEEEEMRSDDDESYDPNTEYRELMERLRTNSCWYLNVKDRRVLDIIFANIDEFCDAVSCSEGLRYISWGDDIPGGADGPPGPKLEVTEENVSYWNKLLQTLGSISSAEKLLLYGFYDLSGSLMVRLVEALQQVNAIKVFLPWYTLDGEDLRPFVEYLVQHPSKPIDDLTFSATDNGRTQEGLFDGTKNHFLDHHGTVAQLFRLESVQALSLYDIKFTEDECKVFNNILSSGECKIDTVLAMTRCCFLDGSAQLVGNALASNKSLKSVVLTDMFQDKAFCDELVACLPLNRLIEDIYLKGTTRFTTPFAAENVDIVGLIKNISSRNKAVVKIAFVGPYFTLRESDIQELQEVLQQNYTLERIRVRKKKPFQTITRLNKAGRRYLSEDSTSNSKCIAVLAKVKNDLDCLYYHLRENPILCISYCSSGGGLSGNKRKASDSV